MAAARRAWVRSALGLVISLCTGPLLASTKSRHFEPDDLQLEHPGTLDFDFQMGPLQGNSDSKSRVMLPDFEIGLGLTPSVELDVSGTFSVAEGTGQQRVSGDALWLATKLGLFDTNDGKGNRWAIGLELGPRLPTLAMAGVGYGALALFGFRHRGLALVLNAGSLVDPAASLGQQHPSSLVFGLDLNAALDTREVWSLQSELGSAHYLSSNPDELSLTLGATYAVSRRLDVSLTALAGFLPNTDHAGLLLGVSPQFGLW